MRLLARLALALGLLLAAAAPAAAWWNKDWQYRVRLTADAGPNGAKITEPIGRTQILLRLHQGDFDFSATRPDGGDLRFIGADDKTPLHYHIERFSQTDQVALVWIDLPDLAPGTATPFYLYWGNERAADGSDPRGTYDADQLLVYHFGEANGLPKDTTAFGNNALTAGARDEAGLIVDALRLDREKPLLRIAKSATLAIPEGQAMTFAMWVQPEPAARSSVLFSVREGAVGFSIGLDEGRPYAQIDTGAGSRRSSLGRALPAGGWHHIAVVAAEQIGVLVDGQPYGTLAGTLPAINAAPVLGGSEAAGAARYAGLIDELQIAKAARPPGAIAVAVASQGPDARLVSFDLPEQAGGGFENSYIVIIFRSVTPDAWVVITILALMAMTTWVVMARKATYLNRLQRGNRAFHAEYRRVLKETEGDHMVTLGRLAAAGAVALKHSSLHRLAKIGVREMDERLQAGRLQPGGSFSPQTLAAIRAAMETGLAHEQGRLSNLMVLLTVAISGGPFLGLLGTVMGVMITFAAIAAAGDVNVNAIAPGVAAALLATVAGLFVAIPAMFGYNYLLIRIKDAGVDMAAFVNETVTRMGEARAMMRPPAAPPPLPPAPSPAPAAPPAAAAKPITPRPAAAKPAAAARPLPARAPGGTTPAAGRS